MLIKYHWYFRLILPVLAILFLLIFAYKFEEPSIIFTALLLFLTGTLITIEGRSYRIFQISFCWLTIFAIGQASFFFSEYHQLFDSGGDDRYFFENWILAGYYDFSVVYDEYNPYKTFVLPAIFYLKFINAIGFESTFSFHINLINAFVASFIPLFVYKIGKHFFNGVVAQQAAYFVAIFPFFNYQCVKIMRDVDVYMLFTMAVLTLVSKWSKIAKSFIFLVILVLILNLRKEAAIYILVLVGVFIYSSSKSTLIRVGIFGFLLICFGAAYYYVNITYGLDFATIIKFSQMYDELRADVSDGNSLATQLKNAGILGKIISVPYIWLSPLPPPALISFNSMNLLISIGSLTWYFLFPRGVIELYHYTSNGISSSRKSLGKAILFTILFGSLFISYTSGDTRHILVFFPVLAIFCFGYFMNKKRQFETQLNQITVAIGLIGIIAYIYIKFLTKL